MAKLKIKPEFIGSQYYTKTLGRSIKIEEGKEKLYKALGFDIFEKNATSRKRKNEQSSNDGNGVNND